MGCSLEEIRQAYRRLVQENLDDEAAFAELKEAYEALTTPARRAEYDLAAWGETFSTDSAESSLSLGVANNTGLARLGRCPMGAEAQCPVLQARIAATDKFCPECGYQLSSMNADGGFDLPPEVDPARQARLEEPNGRIYRAAARPEFGWAGERRHSSPG